MSYIQMYLNIWWHIIILYLVTLFPYLKKCFIFAKNLYSPTHAYLTA